MMSPVIAFDIAVVAQKVKVQFLYNGRYAKSEKVGCWWVSSRPGWLLELLMELKIAIYCPQGSGTLCQQLLSMHGIALYHMVLHGIACYCIILHGIA